MAGVPGDLEAIFRRLASHRPEVVKLAVSVADACDAIPLWKLLQNAPASGVKLVPVAMGEAGKWTRILGAAFGSPITYASLETGSETAAGQISASELTNLYRVKEINDETGVYGLLAGDTSYSLSPYLHNPCFRETGLNAVFIPLQTSSVGQFITQMVSPKTREIELNFKGFAVTNPHKRAIMQYLDTIDDTARSIGAVNTVKVDGGKLLGSNTDAPAFIEPLKNRVGDLRDARAAVIGAGGAARACLSALSKEHVKVCVFARDPGRASQLAGEFHAEHAAMAKSGPEALGGFDIIINATPLGTRGPMENASALTAEHFRGAKVAYDLTYNPAETVFLREAKAAGPILSMRPMPCAG
jgi:3-dehydroquinate dehydratase/shikimate dehydrogenase